MAMVSRVVVAVVALFVAAVGADAGVWDQPTAALVGPADITIYRSPSCGCCSKWIDHVKRHGFSVTDIKENDMDALKQRLGIPNQLKSCHTALVGGDLIEGHVPAADIKRLLTTKPPLAGIAVPGMPVGTPGMEMGARKDPFAVIGFSKDGRTSAFSEYPSH